MTRPLDDRELPRGVAAPLAGPVHVHFDGACEDRGGTRIAAFGYTLEGAGLRHEDFGLAVPPGHPRATNNVAEYVGAICALEWLSRQGYVGDVRLTGDSQLVLRQLTGEYRVRAEHLRPYHERLLQLVRSFRNVEFAWVPRSENARADELSKRGIDLARPTADSGLATPGGDPEARDEPPSPTSRRDRG
jgi:ribonuclease HI